MLAFSFLLFSILFIKVAFAQSVYIGQSSEDLIGSTYEPYDSNTKAEKEEQKIDDQAMKELFGDDQVFPFAAGLDSY